MKQIQPALTSEEWANPSWSGRELSVTRYNDGDLGIYGAYEGGVQAPPQRHALAALALHGQPFGFTWEDVDAVRRRAHALRDRGDDQAADPLYDLADRIAALLPPRP